ncbi:membrane protein [Ornithinimicrobium tianjinense]|uniref:Membrane protein n=2 Tax=Ornithinimicrobium tianjinense TaxID=1195761 RepID=A0A917F2I4_9MICO|nr:membrane protein [Ornithinimicrobium tianjinense]
MTAERARARAADPRRQLTRLGPLDQLRAGRLARRVPQLLVGLVLYGVSMALLVRGTLGVMPWDVLHQGVARHLPLTFGQVVIAVSVVVLLLWIPIRQAPGLGTIANAVLIGLVVDPAIAMVPEVEGLPARAALVVAGLLLNGAATAMYIGAQLGPGPRDGLMTGLARRTGRSIRLVRTSLEVAVVLLGWALGGVLGIATVAYALLIGPITQAMLPWFVVPLEGDS